MMTINFEETELRLGLPGGSTTTTTNNNEDPNTKNNNGKRGYCETTNNAVSNVAKVDLKLNLNLSSSSSSAVTNDVATNMGVSKDLKASDNNHNKVKVNVDVGCDHKLKDKVVDYPSKPPAKAQVVGWPPVRSFRKNIVTVKKSTEEESDQKAANNNTTTTANTTASSVAFVKVSMDGAPYLRKVDLKLYKSYQDLSNALAKMFSSFTIGNCGSQGMKDFMNESKLIDVLNGSEYAATYEDKDGDWMLVGDVPWPMFVESCKRLRIMKGSEAIGLAPRAVEKCKSRS